MTMSIFREYAVFFKNYVKDTSKILESKSAVVFWRVLGSTTNSWQSKWDKPNKCFYI